MNTLEKRSFPSYFRFKGRKLIGYAAVFNKRAVMEHVHYVSTEVIEPGAFKDCLASGSDILCLVDHNPEKILGRTSSGTLKLKEDSYGLAFELSLPETQLANDVLELAERGDLGGMSIGFTIEEWRDDLWDFEALERTLYKIKLEEISVVSAWPAYPGTKVEARKKKHIAALAIDIL